MSKKKHIKSSFPYKLIPIIIVLCLVPLIVYTKIIEYDTSNMPWYTSTSTSVADIFNYYKAALLLASASIMLIRVSIHVFSHRLKLNQKLYAPAFTYIVLAILSTFTSISFYYSTKGYINHLENVFVLIAYIIVFIYTSTFLTDSNDFLVLTKAWMVSIFLLFLIGLTQFLGFDLYRTQLGMALIIPNSLKHLIEGSEFTLWSDNLIYQSLFHYNYVSFYAALVFPFFLALVLGSKVMKERLLYSTVCLILLFNLFGSQGRNGFVGVVIGSLFVAALYGRKVLLNKYVLGANLLIIIVASMFILSTDTILERRLLSVFTELSDDIDYPLNSITTDTGSILIDHDNFSLSIDHTLVDGSITYLFTDGSGSGLETTTDGNQITITSPNTETLNSSATFYMLTYQGYDILQMQLEKVEWNFIFVDDKIYYLNSFGKTETLESIPSIGFDGKERWGSKRGYIWSRTIPMLLEKPLFGYGPDTYAIAFPQNDYVGKVNAYGSNYINTIVDKPHNIYLNYAANTGIPSLLAFLTIVFLALYRTVRLIYKVNTASSGSVYKIYAIATGGSIAAYLSAGFFNDTSLHVTPIFWIIIGMNYAACNILAKSRA